MRINKKVETQMGDKFESMMDFIESLDKVPFYRKQEAAEIAAKAAFDYLKEIGRQP